MLIRRLARPMLAGIFVQGGVQALRDIKGHAAAAGPFLERTVGKMRDSLPSGVPTDAETLVKVDGMVKLGAGTMLALGRFPRFSALLLIGSAVPTTLSAHAFWEFEDPEQRNAQLLQFLKNLALIGGLLMTVVDTKGKPSVGYRAKRRAERSAKAVRKTTR